MARQATIHAGATPIELIRIGFKEIEYVLELDPHHLWRVGPGTVDPEVHVFAVTVDGLEATCARLEHLPSFPSRGA